MHFLRLARGEMDLSQRSDCLPYALQPNFPFSFEFTKICEEKAIEDLKPSFSRIDRGNLYVLVDLLYFM
jgi:hypothetical protein